VAAAKSQETADAKGKEKTPASGKPDGIQPIPEGDESEEASDAELGAINESQFVRRSPNSSSRVTKPASSDFAGGTSGEFTLSDSTSGNIDDAPGEFSEQPTAPPAFGGNNASGGGGFGEADDSRLTSSRVKKGAPAGSDAALDFPADEGTELAPAAPSRLTSQSPAARFSEDTGELKPPAAKRPPATFRPEPARPATELTGESPAEFSAPRSVFDERGARSMPTSSKIGGPHSEGQGAPGPRQLEGVQAPSLALEKAAPSEIQVGKPATFQIKVRNVGQVEAHEVVVHDEVPKGTRFVDATPQAARAQDGSLAWQLGTLRPGEEQTISLQVMPTDEGEIGSVARVSFQAQASARTLSTRPQLKVEHTAPPKVLIGQGITFSIKISNPGTGAATNVVLEEDVPEGLSHPAGNELEFELGTLRPGESKALELTLKAEKAGQITNVLLVRADAGLSVEDRAQVEVIAPQLEVDMKGPARRFLDRQATYVFSVANHGTAPAREVELVAFLPKGFKFVETNNAGQYDAQKHAVYWSLAELPPDESGAVQLVTLPVEPGEQKLRVEGRAELGLADAREQAVLVESVAQLLFEVVDSADPIEIGSDTIYQVRIVNQGTKAATNVRLAAALPPELEPVGGEGPTKAIAEAQRVQFEPLARLAPKSEAVYRIQARGKRPGDPRIRVQLTSDELQTPVTKEEATKVYADQ
jgi:uncharacterized repeat protein (TIGR01451 family)